VGTSHGLALHVFWFNNDCLQQTWGRLLWN
jgi:hypothetical protein